MTEAEKEIVELTKKLLDAIARADWNAYEKLCDASLTCFEPEAKGQLVEGLGFHKFYFQFGAAKEGYHTSLCSPKVRVVGDMALIAYVRLNQRISGEGKPTESGVEETRLWQKIGGSWKHVHFHRSPIAL